MPYIRRAHTRHLKGGKVVHVKAARGNKPYTGEKIKLRHGLLSKYGYSVKLNTNTRRAALNRAVSNYGRLRVYRMLGALMALQMRRAPALSKKYKSNRNYVGTSF